MGYFLKGAVRWVETKKVGALVYMQVYGFCDERAVAARRDVKKLRKRRGRVGGVRFKHKAT